MVVRPSKFGVLFLGQASNVSTAFFTHSDVVNGNLFFHAFDIGKYRVEDEVSISEDGRILEIYQYFRALCSCYKLHPKF